MADKPMMQRRVRPLTPELLDAATAVGATAPDPWRREDWAAAIDDPARDCLAALRDGELVGVACFRRVDEDSGELEMLAVRPDMRRLREGEKALRLGVARGIGESLTRFGLYHLYRQGAKRCLLEVRAGNIAAIRLYEKVGFTTLARRPGLYAHPPEDGLSMEFNFEDTEL